MAVAAGSGSKYVGEYNYDLEEDEEEEAELRAKMKQVQQEDDDDDEELADELAPFDGEGLELPCDPCELSSTLASFSSKLQAAGRRTRIHLRMAR